MKQPAIQSAITQPATLDAMCASLLEAKAQAEQARRQVLDIEEAIAQAVGTKDEGSFSVDCDAFKVTTTQPVTRSVNKELALDVMKKLPADLAHSIFDWKPSLNVRVFKDLQRYQPAHYATITPAVTSKPGKVAVKVQEVAQ